MGIETLIRRIGHEFKDPALLRRALTHRSYGMPHNERLEFLGDSVLNCSIATHLYHLHTRVQEGDLSRMRAHLVKEQTLSEIAASLNLGDYLQLGEGELKSGGFRRPSILADTLEAIIGAVYLDAGFIAAEQMIARLFEPLMKGLDPKTLGKDPKTLLQEYLQGRKLPLPNYTVLSISGEAHQQHFEVECAIPAMNVRACGGGVSRRSAEQTAAGSALQMLNQQG
ncbi:MAG: ribonuclease III [Betaproteobacteria bacterium]|nr:ribonuclease III [Betaproteobacteria bacterium]